MLQVMCSGATNGGRGCSDGSWCYYQHLVLLPAGFGAGEHAPTKVCFLNGSILYTFIVLLTRIGPSIEAVVLGCLH
jgi:hypothetical protein